MVGTRVLACLCSVAPTDVPHFDPTSSVSGLASLPHSSDVEVKVLNNPSYDEFQQLVGEFKPTLVYLGAGAEFDQSRQLGSLQAYTFQDGTSADSILGTFFAGKGVETLYVDAKTDYEQAKALQARGDVPNVIAWSTTEPPATIAAQFSRTFFCVLFTYATPPNEAYTMASHVVQAHCTTQADGAHVTPALPAFLSSLKAELPDNSSIPPLDVPGMDPAQSIASLVPGWSDLRLLAPRAELRLLLCGGSSLIDSHKLSFLGEALRALLIMETRSMTVVSTSSCAKVPVNLAAGCAAVRCEVRTASGRQAVVVLGGPPDVLKDTKLVEHALRMTLVSDSQSLQFRLPPPGVAVPAPRSSAAIAGNTPVVDTLVLTSVWAVQVLRSLCEDAQSLGVISMGVAAVGASATAGVTAADAQRMKMLISGRGPAENPAEPLQEEAPEPADAAAAEPLATEPDPPAPPPLAGEGPATAAGTDPAAGMVGGDEEAGKPEGAEDGEGAGGDEPMAAAGQDVAMDAEVPEEQEAAETRAAAMEE